MELIRRMVPYNAAEALKLLEDTFGYEEVVVEAPQLMGAEVAANTDIVWEAWEDGRLLGTIHATIPRACPTLCGLSAMATHPSVRGKGLGRILFAKIIEEFESQGVTAAFLGTSNPIAAKLYHSLGFSFVSGSHVMVRYKEGDTVDFCRANYASLREDCKILKDDSAIRIPMIPLVVMGATAKVLDVNTGLFHRDFVTQRSCMGLYPRYDTLLKQGGHFYAAVDGQGFVGALLSTMPTEAGIRGDFFCCDGFEGLLPKLLSACDTDFYLQVAQCDEKKQAMAAKLGFSPVGDPQIIQCGDIFLPFRIYK